MKYKMGLILFILFLKSMLLFSQQLNVESILANMKKAVDPKNKLNQVKTQIMTGILVGTVSEPDAKMQLMYKHPNMMRLDLEKNKKDISVKSFDGTTGWEYSTIEGYRQITDEELDELKLQAIISAPYVNYKKICSKIELIGEKKVNDRECYKLRLTPRKKYHSEPIIFYVDKTSFLIQKTEEIHDTETEKIEVITIFNNYKFFEGIKVPIDIVSEVDGTICEYQIESVIWNKKIPTGDFDPPEDL